MSNPTTTPAPSADTLRFAALVMEDRGHSPRRWTMQGNTAFAACARSGCSYIHHVRQEGVTTWERTIPPCGAKDT